MHTSNILIVDDSQSMRQVIAFTLTSAGYEVREVSNGKEALHAAQEKNFDAVLTDINMPEMDGYTLIERLRLNAHYSHTPIITLTTENSEEAKKRARDAGATGWIVKPFDSEKLISVLHKLNI